MRAVILQSDQRRLLQEEGILAESCTVRRSPFGREQSGKEHFIEGTVSTKALRRETLVTCSRPRKEVRDFPGCPVVKTQCLHHRGCGFHFSCVKLTSHMPCGADKNLKRHTHKKRMCSRQNNAPATYIKKNCVEKL